MRIDKQNYAYVYPFALLGCWIALWLIHSRLSYLSTSARADTLYWVSAKIVFWVAPVFMLIAWVERARWQHYLELTNLRKGLVIGLLVSLVLSAGFYLLDHQRQLAFPMLSFGLLNGVIVAPLVEEIVFRGFYLRKLLMNGVHFWLANAFTTLFFLGMHMPGWHFQGKLTIDSMLISVPSLVFISLVLGLVKVKTESLYATIIIHVLNNLYSLAR